MKPRLFLFSLLALALLTFGAPLADDKPTTPSAPVVEAGSAETTILPKTASDTLSGEIVSERAADAATGPPAMSEPDVNELATLLLKVISDWRGIGWVAGVIALINLLMNVLRFKPLKTWFEARGIVWLKPLIAVVLGGLMGGFSTFATGAGVVGSIIAGVVAALGSVGFHELVTKLREREK